MVIQVDTQKVLWWREFCIPIDPLEKISPSWSRCGMLVCWGNDKVHVDHLPLYFIAGSSYVHAPIGEDEEVVLDACFVNMKEGNQRYTKLDIF